MVWRNFKNSINDLIEKKLIDPFVRFSHAHANVVPKQLSDSDYGDFYLESCQLTRALFGQLCVVMSSTNATTSSLSHSWQLVTRYPEGGIPMIDVPTDEEGWWIYHSMMELFPFTAWPLDIFERNVAALFVKILKQRLIETITYQKDSKVEQSDLDLHLVGDSSTSTRRRIQSSDDILHSVGSVASICRLPVQCLQSMLSILHCKTEDEQMTLIKDIVDILMNFDPMTTKMLFEKEECL